MNKLKLAFSLICIGLWIGMSGVVSAEINAPSDVTVPQAVYNVDRNDDASGLACTSAANDCSLRSAIELSNGTVANDAISFSGDRTINLTSPLPTISDDLGIVAFPSQTIRIDANGARNIFRVSADNVAIDGLMLYGAALDFPSDLVIVSGSAENFQLRNSTIGDYVDEPNAECGDYDGGLYGLSVEAETTTPAGPRAYIYGNTFRCLRAVGIILDGSRTIIGQNLAGAAGVAQINSIYENDSAGISVVGSDNHLIRNNTIRDNGSNGIVISSGDNNSIYGNLIDGNGTSCCEEFGAGVHIGGASTNNLIGCPLFGPFDAAHRNTIINSAHDGIRLDGSTVTGNFVYCNYIGISEFGFADNGNGANGIALVNGAHGNFIGATANQRNVISDNDGHGIYMQDSDDNLVQGNHIGTDIAGTAARGNGQSGIAIWDDSADTIIGGSSTANINVISGNGEFGIHIDDASNGTDVRCNQIGIKATATLPIEALGNAYAGIGVYNASRATIGTTCTGGSALSQKLMIGYNGAEGIFIEDSSGVIVGQQTYVWNNVGAGITINNASNNTVRAEYLLQNGGPGIGISGTSANNDAVANSNFSNGGLAIDLGFDGLDSWDSGDGDSGPNTRLNYPTVTTTSGWVVSGIACANCDVLIFEGFTPELDGGGGNYLGFTTANGVGVWSYDLAVYSGSGGNLIASPSEAAYVAIDPSGNSSEMSGLAGRVATAVSLRGANAATSAESTPTLFFTLLSLLTLSRLTTNHKRQSLPLRKTTVI